MIKYVSALVVIAALGGCSSDSNSGGGTTGSSTGNGTSSGTTGGTSGGTGSTTAAGGSTGGSVTPSGSRSGVWFGNNNFGDGVMVIDSSENIYAFSGNGGQYHTVFGPASEQLQVYVHRDSDNPAYAESFTLAGDRPSVLNPADADNITYNLTVANEGQQINNTSAAGNFSMTFATENDLAPLSLAEAAGTWSASTSFCPPPTDCRLSLSMSIDAAGVVSGGTQFNDGAAIPLNGNAAPGGPQYLTVSFQWNGNTRTGVIHRDRRDPNRLLVNTVGPDEGNLPKSFSASLIRR